MTEPTKAQTIDTELARHCAFTFPGAVLALGKDNWHCLKETYELLASDMQVCSQSSSCSLKVVLFAEYLPASMHLLICFKVSFPTHSFHEFATFTRLLPVTTFECMQTH